MIDRGLVDPRSEAESLRPAASRPRLAYVITKAELGGAQVHVADLIEHFRTQFDLLLVCGEEGFLTERARTLGVPCEIEPQLAKRISPIGDLLAAWRLARLFRTRGIVLVHAHSSKAGILGRLGAALARVTAIFTAHGWAFAPGAPRLRRWFAVLVEAVFSRLARIIIAVSEQDARLARRLGVVGADRMVVIRNGVADGPRRTPKPASDRPPRIVMVGRFAPQKDQGTLLEAVARLSAPCTVTLVGDGPDLPRARELAARLGLADRVNFVGATPDVDQHLAEADVFVLATRWEGLPLVILEAMRHGLPVVASDVGGVGEAVVEGETGFLVRPCDRLALAEALERLLDRPALRRTMGAAGRARYDASFTRERMVADVEAVYRGVLGAPVIGLTSPAEARSSAPRGTGPDRLAGAG